MRRIWAAIFCVIMLLAGRAAATEDAGVQSEMVASRTAVKAGDHFDLAITLTVPDEKHIYWVNPGDAGQATKFKFTPIPGVEFSTVHYPIPEKFVASGNIVTYGYKSQVTFLLRVAVSKDYQGANVNVEGTGSWLCCDDKSCELGSSKISVTVPVADDGAAANAQIFKDAIEKLPSDTPLRVFGYTRSGNNNKVSMPLHFDWVNCLYWKVVAKNVDVYPTARAEVELSHLRVETENSQTRFALDGRALPGQAIANSISLPMLVVYTDIDNTRRGVYFDVPLITDASAGK